MTEQQTDVIVIGLGPGGEHVAGRLAEAGLDVVGIEAELVGGECPYWGCVPSKMMIRAGNLLAEARRIPGLAGDSRVAPDWAPVAARIRDEATDDWNDQVAVDRLTGKGGRFVRGRARLTGPGRVAVDDLALHARRGIVLATGARPTAPPVPGLADIPYWTNRDAVATKELPESLLVLGGGAIGLELAQVFARFGTTVTVVEALDHLLPAEEPEAGRLAAEVLEREGVGLRTGARAVRAEHDGVTFTLRLEGGELLSAERLLVATGRRAELAGLGVETVGLDPTAHAVPTDGRMRAADGVWAIGDVTGHGAFTHVAMYEAGIAVRDILGEDGPEADYRALPRVTFTDPEVGAVGMTERQARAAGLRVRTGSAPIPSSARGWIHKAGNDGFVKLVEDADRGVLVGATSAGPAGGEMLYGLAVAVQAEVATARLRHMIYAYPTFHRAIEAALADLG
ncbi:NAD(P)/FAD-dependent oxidoreductase [Kitasatospora paracochleata]|uniref:Pyruvate/2-oxoglutarate dehydrogenase complex dihydrolipoamide dehydrogenase (E3) component n=1 Tax=Kitasatospora paracochleata TaxID=58354 RepID=A0ABT1IVI9_9ACTN|nr:NAD(P)/FAD-dependent oxidoreductase [Kitasatospora paracochleata]MCP2309137.1 pyruvate/2-oxoglutarate dehydrogenase complex dihydrolipoamide dehydrogenase (E3) component [Kitasatospora paracochleata]